MQKISQKLTAASAVLLGMSSPLSAQAEPWLIDVGVMNFTEQDRNTGLELMLKGTRATDEGGSISIAAELDVITGATPNGASSSDEPQVFTMASGIGHYTVKANELPADDTHMDTRLALKTAINDPIDDDLTADYNALISMEFDYLSFAGGGALTWDFNKKNTTLSAGVNAEYNRVHPVGNTSIPFAAMQPAGQPPLRGVSAKSKIGQELGIGINQVIDRSSLIQLRLTTSHFRGYLTDSYKLLSVVQDENTATPGRTVNYRYENRPSKRTMNSLYLAYKKSYQPGILDVSYRLYDDDWEIRSNTVDVGFKFKRDKNYFLRPSLRLYHQSGAYFYRHSLVDGEELPEFASAELRLGEFTATTLGLELGKDLAIGRKQSLSIEYYTQQGESHPDDAIGLQRQQDLFPTLKTWVIRYVFAFKW
jgi:hypothetical protein